MNYVRAFLLASLLFPSIAAAQSPRVADDRGWAVLGYSFLSIHAEDSNVLAGWLLSTPLPVTTVRRGEVAIKPVLEFSGNYWRQQGDWVKVHTVQAGPRIRYEGSRRFRPFAQLLIGGAFVDCCQAAGRRLSIEPGGGVDFTRRNSASKLRISAGVPIVFGEGASLRLFRVHVGWTSYPDTL